MNTVDSSHFWIFMDIHGYLTIVLKGFVTCGLFFSYELAAS